MAIAALRYNNPFDVSLPIAGWNGGGDIAGIQGQPGFGSFPDMATGYKAGVHRLNTYLTGQSSHGPKRTIKELNSVYATDPNWAAGVAAHSGLDPNATIDPANADQFRQLQYGVLAQEMGPKNAAQILAQHGGGGGSPVSAINSAAGITPQQGRPALAFSGEDDETPASATPTSGALAPGSGALSFNDGGSGRKDNRFGIGDLFGASDETKEKMHGIGARLVRAAAAASAGVNPAQAAQFNALGKSLEEQNKTDFQYMMGPNGQVIKINKDTGAVNVATLPGGGAQGNWIPHFSKDAAGNSVYAGRFHQKTGEFLPASTGAPAQTGPQFGGDPSLTGDERYASLDPKSKNFIDQWETGNVPAPTAFQMNKDPNLKAAYDAAQAIGIDFTKFPEKKKFAEGYASKNSASMGGQLLRTMTAMKQIGDVGQNYLDLNNSPGLNAGGAGSAVTSQVANFGSNNSPFRSAARDTLLNNLKNNSQTASNEVQTVLSQGKSAVTERAEREATYLQPNASPLVHAGILETEREQLTNRYHDALAAAKTTMGSRWLEKRPEIEGEYQKQYDRVTKQIETLKERGKGLKPAAAKPGAIPSTSWDDAQKAGWK